jgi:hypothetical protein
LKAILELVKEKVGEAAENAGKSSQAYDDAMGMKPDFDGLLEQINMLVDELEMAKSKAKDALNDAELYQDT